MKQKKLQRIAVIDIGTNSTLLLVAEVENKILNQVVYESQEITRLGELTGKSRNLKPDAISRTVDAIARFVSKAKSLDAQKIHLIATNAVRIAENGREFKQAVMDKTQLPVTVLSGMQEAEATYHGVLSGHKDNLGISLVIDCGGGSTELVFGSANDVMHKTSVGIGSAQLTEQFDKSNFMRPDEFAKMTVFLDRFYIRQLPVKIPSRRAFGVGGTITTLAAISLGLEKHDPTKINGHILSRTDIWNLVEKLRQLPDGERKQITGLPEKRADTIVAGATIYATLLNYLDVEDIIVSTRGVRYGVILNI